MIPAMPRDFLNLKLSDFRNCCRLCFETDACLENVLTTNNNIVGKIFECLNVSILPEDTPATLICQSCCKLVDQFNDFKQLCKKHEYLFQTSIRSDSSNLQEEAPSIQNVDIKNEIEEEENMSHDQQTLMDTVTIDCIKQEPDHSLDEESTWEDDQETADLDVELESEDDQDTTDDTDDDNSNLLAGKRKPRGSYRKTEKKLLVRLIHNGYLMNCKFIKLNGVMHWVCRNSACKMSFTATLDWTITLHAINAHNHSPFVDKTGMIKNEDSGLLSRFSLSSVTGKDVLIWNGYEWYLDKMIESTRKAICKDNKVKCKCYVIIKGDYESLKEFCEHNHQKKYILYRNDTNPDENDVNPWDLFVQINPCKLPLGTNWELNQRVKLFYNRYQYRLVDCTWNGTSRWVCDTVNCPVYVIMEADAKVSSVEHNHEPLVSGIFNRLFYSVVRGTNRSLKLFFNGHCYGNRESNNWVCTTGGCYAKLHVGSDYKTFAMKGQHAHEGFSVVVKPLTKKAVFLTAENPFLPSSVTIEDLQDSLPSTSNSVLSVIKPVSAPKVKKLKETLHGSIRLIYDGYRYSLWGLFPDGTTYWGCWGVTCKKSVHMTPQGAIYYKNESMEHQHPPQVTKVDQIEGENGEKEWYAIYRDTLKNTILVYRNTLWELLLGEQCYVATCNRCETKLKITANFSRFVKNAECTNHDDSIILIRVSAKPSKDDLIIWDLYKKKFPLQLSDGTIYDKGRHSQLFYDGYRYTLVSVTWTGGELWRCAVQKCPAKCKIAELHGDLSISRHSHDPQVLLQGKIWSEARHREEQYFVVMTLKKTIATLYYNTYTYALKDKRRNVWSCFPGPCHALLRVEGDFERVVEEQQHSHDGTLTFIRTDETYKSQTSFAPAIGTSVKRKRDDSDCSARKMKLLNTQEIKDEPSSIADTEDEDADYVMDETSSSGAVDVSPKLQVIISNLVQPVSKKELAADLLLRHHGGYTYNRSTELPEGGVILECNMPKCPGRVIIGDDKVPRSEEVHTHTKMYNRVGSIQSLDKSQSYPYILVNASQRRTVTYFVCDGYRYAVQTRAAIVDTTVVWQCIKCPVKATVTECYSYIQLNSQHDHDPCDMIITATDDNSESTVSEEPSQSFQYDELIWDRHRYNKPTYIRRFHIFKWRCFRRECKAYLSQNTEGLFKEVVRHDHDGPVDICSEAIVETATKQKERFATLKNFGKSKMRHLVFQNQIYLEGKNKIWECVRKSCTAQLTVRGNFDTILSAGTHNHQPAMTRILYENEVQSQKTSNTALDVVLDAM